MRCTQVHARIALPSATPGSGAVPGTTEGRDLLNSTIDATGRGGASAPAQGSPAFLRLLTTLVRWRRFILLFTAAAVVVAVGLSYVVTPVYQSEVVIYPAPPEGGLMGGESSSLSSLKGLLGESGSNSGADLIQAVMETRSLAQVVLVRLGQIPLEPAGEDARRKAEDRIDQLRRNISVDEMQTGAVRVRTKAKTAELAARTANLYAALADSMIRAQSQARAAETRAFLDRRIAESRASLVEAQARLMSFQRDSNAVSLEAQAEALVKVGSELQSELMRLDAEITAKRRYLTEGNPLLQELLHEREALVAQARRLNGAAPAAGPVVTHAPGGDNGDQALQSDVLLPGRSLPSLGVRYANLYLAVEVQKQVLLYLNNRLEEMKLEESQGVATLQVIDPAARPPWRNSPRRKLVAVASLVLGLFGGAVLALVLQAADDGLSAEDRAQLRRLAGQLRWSRLLSAHPSADA